MIQKVLTLGLSKCCSMLVILTSNGQAAHPPWNQPWKPLLSCPIKVLPMHAKSDVLEPAVEIAKKAHAQHSATVDVALFDALAKLFSRLAKTSLDEGGRRGANQSDKEDNVSGAALEAFSEQIVALLTSHESSRPHSASSEKLRKSRVNLAVSLAQSEVGSPASRVQLASIFDTWLESERSRPLREEIQKGRDGVKRIS